MILPHRFKLKHHSYEIHPCQSYAGLTGSLYPEIGFMEVATRHRKGPRKPEAIQLTFWHEATHAILHDMGSPHWADEQFVTEFSKRLVKLINTAEFK